MTEYERRPKSQATADLQSRPVLPVAPVQRIARPVPLPTQRQTDQPGPTVAPIIPAALCLNPASAMTGIHAQRQAVRPVLAAATLSQADQALTQHTAQQLAVQRHTMRESGAVLAEKCLRPQPEHLLPRFAPPPQPSQPYLTPVQRQVLNTTADNQISSALSANARYLPPAARADVAAQAVQRFGQQGLDPEPLRELMVQRAPDDATREAAQGAVALQRRREQKQAQQRSDHALLTQHATLQRQLKGTEAQHVANQADTVARIEARRGGGQPLPGDVRLQLELGLNHDLSGVRVHTDAEADLLAKGLQAVAFTTGKNIYFQSGQFDPVNKLELLAHEVTHVKQQDGGQVGPGLDPDAGLEAEAKANETALPHLAVKAVQPTQAVTTTPMAVQRKASSAQAPAPKTVAPSINETVLLLRKISIGVPATSKVFQAELQAMLELKSLDPAFWTQVAALGHEHYGPAFIASTLIHLPQKLQASLSLALLGGEAELTYEAFINQLSYMAYSNAPDLSDVKLMPRNANASTRDSAQAILKAAGYRARPTMHGLWGFQMRVFEPVNAQAKYHKTVVAFRGTEGVAANPAGRANVAGPKASLGDNESELDTMTDLAAYDTAYSQYEANQKAIVDPLLKTLGSNLVATGHSLGGGLAQIAAAKHAGQFGEVCTFQAANISKTDVERLAKQNAALQARQFRVLGDLVPTSGEAAVNGEIVEVRRSAAGANIQNLSAVGGHNAPIALELLREVALGNAIDKSNKLAQALIQYGSLDPVDERGGEASLTLSSRYPTSKDTTPGQEASKQDNTGKLFLNKFVNTYKNNAVYNILAEESFKQLGEIGEGLSAEQLVRRLLRAADETNAQPIRHTESSRLMLKVIFEKVEQDYAKWDDQLNAKLAAKSHKECESLEFDLEIIEENKRRFKKNALDLWYSLNPEAEQLYVEAKKLWPEKLS